MEGSEKTHKKRSKKTKRRRRSSAFTKAKQKIRKIAVIGSTKVGKTALIKRFVDGAFSEDYKPTVDDLYFCNYKYKGQNYSLQIVDMASPFQFPSMRDLQIQAAHVILLVYEIENEKTYDELKAVRLIIDRLNPSVPVVLAGTNEDKIPIDRQTSDDYLNSLYREDIAVCGHVLTSAKDDKGVKEVFEVCLEQLLSQTETMKHNEVDVEDDIENDSSKCIIL